MCVGGEGGGGWWGMGDVYMYEGGINIDLGILSLSYFFPLITYAGF